MKIMQNEIEKRIDSIEKRIDSIQETLNSFAVNLTKLLMLKSV